jgi:hypothetical protein
MFGFVPRSQLIKLVPHFGEVVNIIYIYTILFVRGRLGFVILFFIQKRKRDSRGRKCQQTIGNLSFITFVQFFLHKFGEVTLGQLWIYPSKHGGGPIVRNKQEWPLADVPIPENVKNFESIIIRLIFYNKV